MACLLLQSLIVHHVQEPILNFTWKTPKVSNQQLSYHNILNVFILMYKFIYFICDRNVLEAWSWILASYLTRISLVKDFIFLEHIFDFFVFFFFRVICLSWAPYNNFPGKDKRENCPKQGIWEQLICTLIWNYVSPHEAFFSFYPSYSDDEGTNSSPTSLFCILHCLIYLFLLVLTPNILNIMPYILKLLYFLWITKSQLWNSHIFPYTTIDNRP